MNDQPEYKFHNNDKVLFDSGHHKGSGWIKGAALVSATSELLYIIKIDDCPTIPSDLYPFEQIVMTESNITKQSNRANE